MSSSSCAATTGSCRPVIHSADEQWTAPSLHPRAGRPGGVEFFTASILSRCAGVRAFETLRVYLRSGICFRLSSTKAMLHVSRVHDTDEFPPMAMHRFFVPLNQEWRLTNCRSTPLTGLLRHETVFTVLARTTPNGQRTANKKWTETSRRSSRSAIDFHRLAVRVMYVPPKLLFKSNVPFTKPRAIPSGCLLHECYVERPLHRTHVVPAHATPSPYPPCALPLTSLPVFPSERR